MNAKPNPPPSGAGLRDRARASRSAASRALHAKQPTAGATLAPACAVSRMGERLAEAHQEYWALDELPTADKTLDIKLQMKRLEERQNELEQAISYGRAGSAGGILTQLCVAFDALGAIKEGSTEAIQESADARAERCLLSIAAALCAWTGVDRMGFGAADLMPLRIDALSVLSPEVS